MLNKQAFPDVPLSFAVVQKRIQFACAAITATPPPPPPPRAYGNGGRANYSNTNSPPKGFSFLSFHFLCLTADGDMITVVGVWGAADGLQNQLFM